MSGQPDPAGAEVLGLLDAHQRKDLLRFLTCGSVDDGKSTLIGRLLYDSRTVFEDQLAALESDSRKAGTQGDSIDFALLVDGLSAEREQGITIDVAYRYFATARRKFILADTPGHVQYTRNMATGASTADVAIILVDARLGVLAQTRRHAYITGLLGISELVVAINKMDLVDFEESIFHRLVADCRAVIDGRGFRNVTFIPVSARRGDNVARRSPKMPWYEGPTVLSFLEEVPLDARLAGAPLRFPVQYVIRPDLHYRGYAGTLAVGTLRPGDPVLVLPSGRRSTVEAIDLYHTERASVSAPESVTLRLADEVDVARGDMIVSPEAPPRVRDRLRATLVWMHDRPSDPHRRYLVKHTTRTVPAQIEAVLGRVDLDKLDTAPAEALALNDIGPVVLRLERPLFVDPYAALRATGALIVIDALTNDTVAAGMIDAAEAPPPTGEAARYESPLAAGATKTPKPLGRLVWIRLAPERDRAEAYALTAALETALDARGERVVVTETEASLVNWTTRLAVEAGATVLALVRQAAPDHLAETRSTLGHGQVIVAAVPDAPEGRDAAVAAVLAALAARRDAQA